MSESISERVAANVRAEAARAKLSQKHIAVALGLSQSSANRRWLGVTPINVDELYALADSFGVPVTTLLPDDTRARVKSA
ncbi:helix-turn-helix DNA-binding protein [Arthrobacter phage Ryan]|uniref:Helix-turn-helix DNA binding protein n=2 Tax=Nanditavirus TaxID=3152637 RepID=A0A3G2KI43_9CAUD|nr:helix-turn-helix DNA-binding protein [Arthrobacter phage Nandita]YP_010760939.1 helix-turn-helix DNA-binding protein [Arthrobacter phage Ryan]AYN58663.1 helix-turn-helix DNA-binding protein [Arthrobacter phage Nandita]AYN59034.1 helix-turn-helix DNA-binding protein [Arthrobacter phage Ryan]